MQRTKLLLSLWVVLCTSQFLDSVHTDSDHDRIVLALQEEPEWCFQEVSIVPVDGGLTNPNYKVTIGEVPYFFRLGKPCNELLNLALANEYEAVKEASEHGIAPSIAHFSPQEAILVSEFIDGAAVSLRSPDAQKRLCKALRQLHGIKRVLSRKLCPFESIALYKKNALEAGAVFPDFVEKELLPLLEKVRKAIPLKKTHVFCHNDLHSGNCLECGEKIWLIDWEYAAMGDPLFDLATLASVEKFDDAEMEELLQNYLEREHVPRELIRYFQFQRALADARWGFWYYLQDRISSIDFFFIPPGEEHLRTCFSRLKSLASRGVSD